MKLQHIYLLTALLLATGKNYVALVGAACPPDGEDPADWVDCVDGVVLGTTETCESPLVLMLLFACWVFVFAFGLGLFNSIMYRLAT